PVSFSELMTHPDQLETTGLLPRPISLDFALPPDLFVWRNSGVPLRLSYRYTEPRHNDDSRLTFHLNQRFIDSYPLQSSNEKGVLTELRLPLRGMEVPFTEEKRLIPAIKVGQRNQLRFGFSFAAMVGAAQHDSCQTLLPPDVHAAIDDHSTLDFSGFPHYIAMPNLSVFAQGGYPFSRMADLSDTIAVMPSAPSAIQTATFLETMAGMGAQIGYPALRLRVMDDWEKASQEDADILLIGHLPDAMKARPDGNLLLDDTRTTLQQPRVSTAGRAQTSIDRSIPDENRQASVSKVSVRSVAPMAAVVGMQTEHFPERSIGGL